MHLTKSKYDYLQLLLSFFSAIDVAININDCHLNEIKFNNNSPLTIIQPSMRYNLIRISFFSVNLILRKEYGYTRIQISASKDISIFD